MARLSQLVPTVAEVLGVPSKTVNVFARRLREADLISSAGRGPGAAHMTPSDAANLVIAVAGSNLVKDAVATVDQYAGLPAQVSELGYQTDSDRFEDRVNGPPIWDLRGFPVVGLRALPRGHSFRDALVALIASAADGSLQETIAALPQERVGNNLIPITYGIAITLWGPLPQAAIRLWTPGFHEQMRYRRELPKGDHEAVKHWEWEVAERFGLSDLNQMREFGGRTIVALGELLGEQG